MNAEISLIILGIILVAGIVIAMALRQAKDEAPVQDDQTQHASQTCDQFRRGQRIGDNSFRYFDQLPRVILDYDNEKVIVVTKEFSTDDYPFQQIIQCSIQEHGETVTRIGAVIAGLILGALIGGLACILMTFIVGGLATVLIPIGAIIGVSLAEIISEPRISGVDIQLIVDDTTNPLRKYRIYPSEWNTNPSPDAYRIFKSKLDELHARITSIIRRNKQERLSKYQQSNGVPSVADELTKLAELAEKGIITKEEFEAQKQRLLSS